MGEHIRAARLIAGLTQQELADKLNCTRQYVHQVENGARLLSNDNLADFMEAVGLRRDYSFYNALPSFNVQLEQLNFCKSKGATASEVERARIAVSVYSDFVAEIEGWVNFPKERFSEFSERVNFSALDANEIERVAESIRMDFDLGLDAPISNMVRLVEKSGAVTIRMPEFSDKIAAFSVSGKRPLIALNETGNAFRSRFKLAHEYAHLIFHNGLETGCDRTEKQADNFAGAILLPRSVFKKEFLPNHREHSRIPFNWSGIYEMKQRWKVSVQAIIHRAFYLQLISQDHYSKAYRYLSKSGEIKVETGDDMLDEEKPEILKASLDLIFQKKNITFEHLVDRFPYEPEQLEKLFGLEALSCKNKTRDNLVLFRKAK